MKLRDVDINLLLVLDALLKDRNAKLSAERLGVSQPTISQALAKLRIVFDDPLFLRLRHGLEPTFLALSLAEPLERMLNILQHDILRPQEFNPKSSDRTFVINTTDIGEMVFVPPLLAALRTYAPRASIQSVSLSARELCEALSSGEVDLAIGYMPDLAGAGIMVQRLFLHPFVCLYSSANMALDAGLTREAFIAADHVALVGVGHDQEKFESVVTRSAPGRRIAFRSQHFMNIPFIIRDSRLVATVPKVIAVAFADLKGLKAALCPIPMPPIPISQYWHNKAMNDAGLKWLRKTIAGLYLNNDPTSLAEPRFDPISGRPAE